MQCTGTRDRGELVHWTVSIGFGNQVENILATLARFTTAFHDQQSSAPKIIFRDPLAIVAILCTASCTRSRMQPAGRLGRPARMARLILLGFASGTLRNLTNADLSRRAGLAENWNHAASLIGA